MNTFSNSHKCFTAALLGALVIAGCADDTQPSGARLDLTRYGVDEIAAEADGAYRLLDEAGQQLGRVDRSVDGTSVALSIDFAGQTAELAWSDADAGSIACNGDHAVLAPCVEGLNIAAELAEADGIDVPAFTASSDADDVEFRVACETISTWVFGGSCSGCYSAAASEKAYGSTHDSGSCSPGTAWTSCSHTFCGGSQLEQSAQ